MKRKLKNLTAGFNSSSRRRQRNAYIFDDFQA
jgi:hypothetical protein